MRYAENSAKRASALRAGAEPAYLTKFLLRARIAPLRRHELAKRQIAVCLYGCSGVLPISAPAAALSTLSLRNSVRYAGEPCVKSEKNRQESASVLQLYHHSFKHNALFNVRDEDIDTINLQMEWNSPVECHWIFRKFKFALEIPVYVPQTNAYLSTDGHIPLSSYRLQASFLLPTPVLESILISRLKIKNALNWFVSIHLKGSGRFSRGGQPMRHGRRKAAAIEISETRVGKPFREFCV